MRYLLFIAVLATLILSACRITKETESSVSTNSELRIKDSTVINRQVFLDTLSYPKEQVHGKISIDLLSELGEWMIRNGRAETKIIYKDGKIEVATTCDSIFQTYIKNTLDSYFSSKIETKEDSSVITNSTTTKKGPWSFWSMVIFWTGVSSGLIIYHLIIRLKKRWKG